MSPEIFSRNSALSGITNPYPSRCIVNRPLTRLNLLAAPGSEYLSRDVSTSFPRFTRSFSRCSSSRRSAPRTLNSRTSCLYPAARFGSRSICLKTLVSVIIRLSHPFRCQYLFQTVHSHLLRCSAASVQPPNSLTSTRPLLASNFNFKIPQFQIVSLYHLLNCPFPLIPF